MSFSVEDILRSHGLSVNNGAKIIKSNTEPIVGVREGIMWYSPATEQTRVFVDGRFRDTSGFKNGSPVLISPNGTKYELSVNDRGAVVSTNIGIIQSYKDKLVLRSPGGINYEIFIDQEGILSTSPTSLAASTFTIVLKSPKMKRFGLSVDDDGRIYTVETYQSETGPWVVKTQSGIPFDVIVDDDGALITNVIQSALWAVTSPGGKVYSIDINSEGDFVTTEITDTTGYDTSQKVFTSAQTNYLLSVDDIGSLVTEPTSLPGQGEIPFFSTGGGVYIVSVDENGSLVTK